MTNNTTTLICCDTHVHFYDCFDTGQFLDSAWSNFQRAASRHGAGDRFSGILLLTETCHDHWFSAIADASAGKQSPETDWTFLETGEDESLLARNPDGRELVIIAGRQLVTSENLEVLALATSGERPDGAPITDTIDWVRQAGGVPVVPWGFGKWWGKRGRFLSRLLDNSTTDRFFLGDNSGRPWFLGKPHHFVSAEHEKRRILPGSDPLPFHSETGRAGSAGIIFREELNRETPAHTIRSSIDNPDTGIDNYMQCELLLPFVRNQVAMQLRKRL